MKPTPAELAVIAASLANPHKGDMVSPMQRAHRLWTAGVKHLEPREERRIALEDLLSVALPRPIRMDSKRICQEAWSKESQALTSARCNPSFTSG